MWTHIKNRLLWRGIGIVLVFGADASFGESLKQPWQKPYLQYRDVVQRVTNQVAKNFRPEFMIIREPSIVATIPVDGFASRVLEESENLFFPYRQGLQSCIEKFQNEYRSSKPFTFEKFATVLDEYTEILVTTLEQKEDKATPEGIREKKVISSRTLYELTRTLTQYLSAKLARYKDGDIDGFSADKALSVTLSDLGRRLLKLDLTTREDARSLSERGLAADESEPLCRITLLPTKDQQASND